MSFILFYTTKLLHHINNKPQMTKSGFPFCWEKTLYSPFLRFNCSVHSVSKHIESSRSLVSWTEEGRKNERTNERTHSIPKTTTNFQFSNWRKHKSKRLITFSYYTQPNLYVWIFFLLLLVFITRNLLIWNNLFC